MRWSEESSLACLWIRQFVSVAILTFLILFVPVSAQQTPLRSLIHITVQDESGNPVPEAKVEIRLRNELMATVTTDEKGEATATNFPPGAYLITVSKDGFERRPQENIALTEAEKIDIK